MSEAPKRGRPAPPVPDDAAAVAALAQTPISGVWFLPQTRGNVHLRPHPTIARDVDISFDPPHTPHPVRDILGIPLERHLFFVTLTDPLGWMGYSYDLIGTEPLYDPVIAPTFHFPNLVIPGIPYLLAYLRRVTHQETALYLETRWHPASGERIALVRPTALPPKTAHRYESQALKLLYQVEGRGRHTGPAGFQDVHEFLETLQHLIRTAHANGQGTEQRRIAELLQPILDRRRASSTSAASRENPEQSTVRVMQKHLPWRWRTFVAQTLHPR